MHKKTMTADGSRYRLVGRVREDGGTGVCSAVDIATDTMVTVRSVGSGEVCGASRTCVAQLVRNHPLNHSPYTVRVLESFWEKNELFVVEGFMDMGSVEAVLGRGSVVSDDFVVYVFMQIVYGIKGNREEEWFWNRIGVGDIWIESNGKVRVCWSRLILEELRTSGRLTCGCHGGGDCLCYDSGVTEDAIKRRCRPDGQGMGNDEYVLIEQFRNLRRIFACLVCGSGGGYLEAMDELEETGVESVQRLFQGVSVSRTLYEFGKILFMAGGNTCDLEEYVRRIICSREISSDPQKIFRFLRPGDGECSGGADEKGEWGTPEKRSDVLERMDEEKKEACGGEVKDGEGVKAGRYGTREYKKGRFHVCEAVPLTEREQERHVDPQLTRKLLRIIGVQSQQISLLTRALRQSQGWDKLIESKLMELEEEVDSMLVGIENHK